MTAMKNDFLKTTFVNAAAVAVGRGLPKKTLLRVYCDCGDVLFGEQYKEGVNVPLFNFLAAMKKDGHHVRLISETPSVYEEKVRALLEMKPYKKAGLKPGLFEDSHGQSVRDRSLLEGRPVLVLVDNDDAYLHGINAMVTIHPDNTDFIESLKPYEKPGRSLPDFLKRKNFLG